jgi:hypothetical protein
MMSLAGPGARNEMMARFPRVLTWIGVIVVVPSLAFAARLVWEQTVWTWDRGPQMVGYSLMHWGLGLLLYLALLAGLVWALLVLLFALFTRSLGGPVGASLLIGYAAAWALLLTPYDFWQRLFVEKLADGRHAADFVQLAAAQGELKTVKAFLGEGVSVDVRDIRGATPLHAAAAGSQLTVVEYLVSKGADVNALDRYGDSPLQVALSGGHDSVARFLESRGAQRIQGSAEYRERAGDEIFRDRQRGLRTPPSDQ